MNVIEPGHIYRLNILDRTKNDKCAEIITFVNRNEGQKHPGTTNQEVLRALIDRVKFMDNQMHWPLNEQIIYHLRMAIALHESRTLVRKVETGKLNIENLQTSEDGHIFLG